MAPVEAGAAVAGMGIDVLVGIGEAVGVDEAGVDMGVGPVDVPLHPASNKLTMIKPAIVGANFLIFMIPDPYE